MNHLDRFGKLRLEYLQVRKPHLFSSMKSSEMLEEHLLHSQKHAKWEFEQLVSAGMDEEAAEHLVLREYILA